MTEPIITQPIKLIVVDLDGTLLTSDHEMTDRSEQALKAAMANGVKVVIATGKTHAAATHLINRLELSTFGIYVQGTVTFARNGSIHSQTTVSAATARQVITFADERGYELAIYSGNRILVRKLTRRMEELTTHFHEPTPEVIGPLQNVLDDVVVNKVIAFAPHEPRKIAALRWHLNTQIGANARLLSAGISDEIEVLPYNVSKGSALKILLKEMGIKSDQVMALGDGENDVEMLQMVGLGVAMGNANTHVKSVADTTTASNDDEGVAQAIEKYVLNTQAKPEEDTSKVAASLLG
ncbi:MAG: HAD family hydrolase [Anaerolineae bacterium]